MAIWWFYWPDGTRVLADTASINLHTQRPSRSTLTGPVGHFVVSSHAWTHAHPQHIHGDNAGEAPCFKLIPTLFIQECACLSLVPKLYLPEILQVMGTQISLKVNKKFPISQMKQKIKGNNLVRFVRINSPYRDVRRLLQQQLSLVPLIDLPDPSAPRSKSTCTVW
ncbi:hypothetical protein RRG08_018033 [Elysia crispata]|uniref:Uncharacterized protein n=1 Tax=Elysia crispata TaxID=231223 RepID=A0AAE1DE52_9GAST|nr:hypothetical protein RRG08_018033 [Elysia crispata]